MGWIEIREGYGDGLRSTVGFCSTRTRFQQLEVVGILDSQWCRWLLLVERGVLLE
ncbi:hypothetical protein [Ferrimicrobium sp.]|uniref:hypothetical protein n=1 Tax=Ferrimicrobium sp. TaxID=2926050 RepID=UPI002608410D|nr:hypothetical protein [Ferrimicrobium sp.]